MIRFHDAAKKPRRVGVDWLSYASETGVFQVSRLVSVEAETSLTMDIRRILGAEVLEAFVKDGRSYVRFKGGPMYSVYGSSNKWAKETGNLADAKRLARKLKGHVTDAKGRIIWPKGWADDQG